jgi:hypothetical protein
MRRLRDDQRLVARNRRNDGAGLAARAAPIQYASGFATGALAAGGTLGILIPPSIPLIIYAIMVEGNIVQLFQGAFVRAFLPLLDARSPTNPLGVKGVGEVGPSGVAAAIGNAVADAVRAGSAINTLPLTPVRILAAVSADDAK